MLVMAIETPPFCRDFSGCGARGTLSQRAPAGAVLQREMHAHEKQLGYLVTKLGQIEDR